MTLQETSYFFVEPEAVQGNKLLLTGSEAFHCSRVLRYKVADQITCVDGRGNSYSAEIKQVKKELVVAQILTRRVNANEPGLIVTLAQGLTRVNKFDWIIEKGTEIGVSVFVPLITEKSVRKGLLAEAWLKKSMRLRQVALAAMKQSLRSVCPAILPPMMIEELAKRLNDYDLSLIATFRPQSRKVFQVIAERGLQSSRILLIVGPESGFSETEENRLIAAGALSVTLGLRRLRAETAGILLAGQVVGWAGN